MIAPATSASKANAPVRPNEPMMTRVSSLTPLASLSGALPMLTMTG